MFDFPKGVLPILATPFTEKGAVDYESLKNLTRWLTERKVGAITMFGFGSEFHKLSDAERDQMIDVVIKEAKGKTPVIVSVTKHSTELAVEDAIYAEKHGADSLMLLPPFIIPPSPAMLLNHIESVCRAVNIPVIVQYAPDQTRVTIATEIFIQLVKKYPQVGFKIECTPPGGVISAIIKGTNGAAKIYVGSAGLQWIEGLERGVIGSMPGSSMVEVYNKSYQAFINGNKEDANRIHNTFLPLLNSIKQTGEMLFKAEKIILKRRRIIASDYCRKPCFEFDEVGLKDFDAYYQLIEKYLDN
jgi:4-hydroxy-tetrahydrodipicolinate synthase